MGVFQGQGNTGRLLVAGFFVMIFFAVLDTLRIREKAR